MRKRTRLTAAGGSLLAAAIGIFGVPAAASASPPSPVVGYTYIDGNTTPANTIDGYARHADGTLTALAGLALPGRGRGPGHRPGLPGRDPGNPGRPVPAGGGRRQ